MEGGWGDEGTEARCLQTMGLMFREAGDHATALEHHRRALGIYERLLGEDGVLCCAIRHKKDAEGRTVEELERSRSVVSSKLVSTHRPCHDDCTDHGKGPATKRDVQSK